jgi:riboflavin synthase
MFTGIIERTAEITAVVDNPRLRRLTLAVPWDDARTGESVAVNGVCLTIAEIGNCEGDSDAPTLLGFDVIQESLAKTNLGLLTVGDDVNLERALRLGDRLDGHFVQGHVDGVAPIVEQRSIANEWRIVAEAPPHLAKFLSPKGSVTLDGVSLTLAAVDGCRFEVALIPTTLGITNLGEHPAGWPLNFEADILSKTIVNWLEHRREWVDHQCCNDV